VPALVILAGYLPSGLFAADKKPVPELALELRYLTAFVHDLLGIGVGHIEPHGLEVGRKGLKAVLPPGLHFHAHVDQVVAGLDVAETGLVHLLPVLDPPVPALFFESSLAALTKAIANEASNASITTVTPNFLNIHIT
jgi:hypothetical protein